MSYDINSLSEGFHNWVTFVAQKINPAHADHLANEIKVGVVNVCTVVLLNTALGCAYRGSIPLTMASLLINGGALLGRVVAERSIQPNLINEMLDKAGISSNPNTPFPDIKGRGLFYISPFMKTHLERFGVKIP